VARAVKPLVPARHPHRVTWSVFVLFLVFAILLVTGTASQLPLTVASHFDAAGQPNAFMSRGAYIRFVLCWRPWRAASTGWNWARTASNRRICRINRSPRF
jgi:hypothetical protein